MLHPVFWFSRVYFVYDKEKNAVVSSHPMFDEVAEALQNDPDYDKHEVSQLFLLVVGNL